MQQRQPRLGDILDDYCPRERRLTNHAVVAMIDGDVKQTRCTTCDAEHEYKHAKVPRQRRKSDSPPALYSQVAAGAPKRIPHDEPAADAEERFDEEPAAEPEETPLPEAAPVPQVADAALAEEDPGSADGGEDQEREEGPVHRPLIRASLPRPEGQPPPVRPAPDFTIRQPGGRPNRFRPRHQRGAGQPFHGNRSNGNVGGPQRGRPPQNAMSPRGGRRHGQGRKRSK
jgi:putative serine protease PepD